MPGTEPVALHEATRRRYLSYAVSVVTARALPDLRDGLKPVQRRILYAMYRNLRLLPGGRYRKSAAVVGEVMAKYHPHGDQAIYDAMVRMAQPFSLRLPLVDGQGNFGSLDGDRAAAMRYTEARLAPPAMELLRELDAETVDLRPTYDGQQLEPVVLPARFPQLLVNGAEGIAVGMATRIPPHNLGEVVDACLHLLDHPEATVRELCRHLRGPDFPTGGLLLDGPEQLARVYEQGSGPLRLRGEWRREKRGRRALAVITSIPYGLDKSSLVERIGALVAARKVPQIVDVRDESTEEVRIVLELRRPEDAEAAMAYLFRHTPLQGSYHVNLTALRPTDNPLVGAPARMDLRELLRSWLDFRFETVRRRLEHERRKLEDRIHVLEGFELVFDALDEAIALIRASEGRREAAERLMDRFELDELQVEAILELKLYRLSRLEILEIREELAELRERLRGVLELLGSERALWGLLRSELVELKERYAEPRRTRLARDPDEAELDYRDEAYIVDEDVFAIVSRDGWIKRQGSFTEVGRIRLREGDAVGWLYRASSRSTLVLFTDRGTAYTLRAGDLPATTGYGEPVQRRFSFADRERVVAVLSLDPRHAPPTGEAVAVTREGRAIRFELAPFAEVSTRAGRRYVKVGEAGVLGVAPVPGGSAWLCMASRKGRGLAVPVEDFRLQRAGGVGLTAMKLHEDDELLAWAVVTAPGEGPEVVTQRGRRLVVTPRRFEGRRGARGAVILRRGHMRPWEPPPVVRTADEEEE